MWTKGKHKNKEFKASQKYLKEKIKREREREGRGYCTYKTLNGIHLSTWQSPCLRMIWKPYLDLNPIRNFLKFERRHHFIPFIFFTKRCQHGKIIFSSSIKFFSTNLRIWKQKTYLMISCFLSVKWLITCFSFSKRTKRNIKFFQILFHYKRN